MSFFFLREHLSTDISAIIIGKEYRFWCFCHHYCDNDGDYEQDDYCCLLQNNTSVQLLSLIIEIDSFVRSYICSYEWVLVELG